MSDAGAGASPPPLDGLLETAIYVEDPKRSARFYGELLGLETLHAGSRLWALAVAGREVLLLVRRGSSADLGALSHDAAGCQHLAFAIPAGALAAWEARLADQGVVIDGRVDRQGGGVGLFFRDPDGHLVELATPGTWTIW